MPGSTPSRTRHCGSRPVTPMSERQQLKLVRQMEHGDPHSGSPLTPDGPRKMRRNGRGETPLHRAAIKGDADAVRKLLEEGADPNTPDFAGWTPLHEACNHGWLDVAEALVDAGADVNVRGLDDYTPLHDATVNAHLELARLLIERGADVQAVNRCGKTPCDLAPPGMLPYLLEPHCIENLALEKRLSLGANDDSVVAEMRRTRVDKSPRVTLKVHNIKRRTGKLSFDDFPVKANGRATLCVTMDEKGTNKEDVYEFKSSKEATPVRGNSTSPDLEKNATEEGKNENPCEQENETQNPSLGKRPAVDTETDDVDEEARKKKKKEETAKDATKPLTPVGRLAAVRSANNAAAKAQSPSKTVTVATRASVNSDRKSPTSPKNGAAATATAATTTTTTTATSSTAATSTTAQAPSPTAKSDEGSEGDGEKLGPKVPPLKIVIPQSAPEPEQGPRNGKNNTTRHGALPYVVSSNSNDGEMEGSASPTDPAIGMLAAEDQKNGQHQRVLRSHRGGEQPSRPGSTGSNGGGTNTAGGSPPVTTQGTGPASGPSSSENSPSSKPEANPVVQASEGSPGGPVSSPPAESAPAPTSSSGSTKGSNPPTPGSGNGDEKTAEASENSSASTSATTDLHPRKRKLKHRGDGKEVAQASTSTLDATDGAIVTADPQVHDQPVKNCYQLYLDIRKQVERRRQNLFPVQPKPPQGYKDYLLNRGTYLLASNASSRQIPSSPLPVNLEQGLRDLFSDQERERHRLRLQHVIEKEKLVLAVEQEILRVHGRAARALANQSVPFSVCTVLRDKEVYNLITPEQEEKDRNARSRYNGRLFLGWLQDVDDKWEKIKEQMLVRHHNEAESLHAVQKMDWEWKLVELGLCAFKSRPTIPEQNVPIVHVSDDFDLLPA